MAQDKIKNLYDTFVKEGYEMESEADFRKNLADPAKRKAAYDALKNEGYEMEAFDAFETNIGFGNNSSGAGQAWKPSEQDKIRMAYERRFGKDELAETGKDENGAPVYGMVHTPGTYDTERDMRRMVETGERLQEKYLQSGRDKRKAAEMQSRAAGMYTKPLGMISGASGEGDGVEVKSKETDNMPAQSPELYGVKYVDGKPVNEWLMPDGSLSTDFVKADNAESGARRQRLQDQFVSRMRENGLDPSKQEDVQRQAQLDYEAPMRNVLNSVWAQAEADAREANKPRRSELLDVGNDFNAYDRALKENDAFDLDKMADKVMKSLPAQYRSRMVSDYMDYYSQHEEELNGRSVEQAAQDALKGEVYGMVYQRAVDAHMPESGYEFLMRKIADQPFSNVSQAMKIAASAANGSYGMASAEMDAMAQYGDQHRVLDITGTVLNMAVDPTTILSGVVGGAVGKEALQLGGKAMMRKVAKDRAGRALGSRLAGRVLAGVAGGSANMATFEMVKNAQGQLTLGGVVNPETGENEGYSLGSILHSGVHGAKMGAATGVVSPLIGNVADGLVKATSSTAGKMALRGGEVAVSKLFEGTIFAASEVYDVQKMPDDKFDLLYAEKYGYDSETDEAKRAEARQKAKNDMSWDAWDDSMAMMIGFGVTHGIKTAPGVIAELRPVKPRVDVSGREIPLTREERIHNRKRFVEHVRDMLDRSPSDIALTKEERAELRAKGYGKLSDLFVKDKKGVKEIKSDGSEVASGDLESGVIFESDALVKKGEYTSRKDFDTADGEFDGYEAMDLLMKDKRVSEAARAKLYYIMTGRMLPMSTVTGWNMARNEDGSITVNSMSQRGGIVTSRTFKTEKEANREIERIKRQAELNTIDVGEQYKEAEAQAFGRESAKPENIRKRLKDETGVDVDAVLRKEPRKRTFEEQEVLERYAKELFPEAETSREAETSGSRPQHGAETKEETEPQATFATDGEREEAEATASRGTEAPAETEASVDAETQADMERISEWMHEAYQDVEDAFGADSVLWMEQIEQNPLAVLENPEITEDQRAAVLNFMNAKAAMSGVEEASLDETARKRMYVEEEVKRRTHSGSGMIIPITTTDGRELYLVNGEVQMYEDGSRAKTSASDRSLVALDPKTGKCEIIAPESVKEMGEHIDPQTELQAAYDAIEAERAEALQNAQKDNGNNEGEDIPEAPQDSSLRSEHNRNEGDINGHHSNEKEASAMDRIPKDAETGAPRFEEVDPETAWDALVEDKLESLADARLKAAEKELAKAQKLKNDEIEYFRHKSRKQEIDKLREDAQRAVDFWKSVKGVGEARAQEAARVEAERIAEEKRAEEVRIAEEKRVEAERLEEERKAEAAWTEQKQRMNEKVRKTAEVVRDCPEAVEVLENTDPQNIWEVASWVLSVNKVVPRNEGVLKGFREMTGYKSGEQRKLVGLFAKAENGGKTLEKLAEDAMQELCNQYGIPYDNNEALNALLDVLQQCGTLGEIRSYIENNRIQQALDTYSNWRRYNDMTPEEETEYEDYMFQQEYGLSRAEYEEMDRQWREYVGDHIEDLAYNFDANEFYGNIADELAAASEAALNIENYGNRQREIAQDAERGDGSASRDESAGAGQVSGRGGELLHKTPSGDANSREANTHGGGFHAPVRDGGVASPSAVEADPSGGKGVDTYDDFKHNNVVRSDEKDDNGLSLVLSSDGTTTFGNIRRGEGIQPLPIKLSEGFNKVDSEGNNIGYGLEHIEAGHGKEIRAAGFRSVTDFVEFVSQGYERILIGNTRKNGTQTYLIEIQDAKSNTLFIELSKDGQYWTVNSGGVFRKNYTGKKKTVEPLPAVEASPVAADEKVQEQGDNPMSGNSSSTVSSGKVTNSASEKQEAGGKSSLGERISAAEAEVNTEPTEAQKKAGNYKMGHVQVGTFDVTIENPKGSVRRGTDANGKQWETTMSHTYGYIRGTESVDGDHIDVFLSSDINGWDGRKVFVVDQYYPDGTFDEHKVMFGFNDRDDAFNAYLSNYEKGWEKGRRLDCTEVSLGDFEKWIESSKRKTKAFADYRQVKGNPEKTPQAAPAGDKVAQTSGSRPHNGVETEAEVPIKAEASGKGDAKFESEYGGAISESFGKYLQFKESRDYDEKNKCLDESWRLLGDLPKRVSSMSEGELDALERDLDALVEGQVKNENDWNAIRYVDWIKKQCGIPERRRELAEERAFQERLASAEELMALAPRKGKVSIEKFADKREGSACGGVYHDADRKAAVATDSHVLVVSDKDYSEDHAGQVVAGGKVLGNRFPNVTKVIPTAKTLAWESGADFGLLEAKAEDALRRAGKLKNGDWVQVAVRLSDGTPVVVDAGMLRDFARGARYVGATSLEMHAIANSNTKLLMARGEDGLALMINRLYDPGRPLYSLTLDGKEDSGRGAAGVGPLDIANEVAEGYRASRDYDDSWMSRSRDNRQPNLFDFDFSQGEQGTSGSRPQHGVEAGASGKTEKGKTGLSTEKGETGMPEVKSKGEERAKRDLFDFDFSQDQQETSVEQEASVETEASGSRPQRGIDDGTSSADSLLDEFAESYAGAAEEYAGLLENGTEAEIAEADSRIEAELSRYAELMTEALQSDGMDYADADRTARELMRRTVADVHVALGKTKHPDNYMRGLFKEGEAYAPQSNPEVPEGKPDATERNPEAPEGKEAGQEEKAPQRYETAGGETIGYVSYGELPALKPGEMCYVERKFSSSGEFGLTGGEEIKSSDDVAYLFRSLENYSVEHTFAVLTKAGARPVVMHLGMGNEVSSIVNFSAVRAAYDAMGGADKIYFVHNHPSGNLMPSQPDNNLLATMRDAYPEGVVQDGIIMDTTSGEYCQFSPEKRMRKSSRPESGGEVNYPVHRFEKSAFTKGYKPTEDMRVAGAPFVTKIVSSLRLGQRDKQNILLCSNSLEVVGCFSLSETSDPEKMASEIISLATRFGGRRIVLFGNCPMDDSKFANLGRLVKEQSAQQVSMLDNVFVENGLNSEPEVVYGDEAGIGQKFVEARDEGVRYRDEEEMPDGERTDDGVDDDTDAKEKHVVQLGSKLNTPVRIIRSEEEVKALPARRDQRAKGWWDGRTGEVVVVLPNNADVADVKNTVVHEVVGHKGLRAFIGEERFDAFLREVYSHAEDSIRKRIDALTYRMVNAEAERLHEEKRKAHEEAGRDSNAPYIPDMAEARVEAERKREEFRKEATEEYMADLGGRIGDEGFEKMSREELTFWGTIKAKVQQFLDK
ncbi:MAG: hypothetical protein HDR94_08240, partial [Bacteroides sp.]|nr:hypothetical protein [Bacteroides sp.]